MAGTSELLPGPPLAVYRAVGAIEEKKASLQVNMLSSRQMGGLGDIKPLDSAHVLQLLSQRAYQRIQIFHPRHQVVPQSTHTSPHRLLGITASAPHGPQRGLVTIARAASRRCTADRMLSPDAHVQTSVCIQHTPSLRSPHLPIVPDHPPRVKRFHRFVSNRVHPAPARTSNGAVVARRLR